jgi:hypothetical protein
MSLEVRLCGRVGEILGLFARSSGEWVGCDWPTVFGTNQLNLQNMSTSQAVLMARGTAGAESEAWWEASRWLKLVEKDADQAESEARIAVGLFEAGSWEEALIHVHNACEIEARHHRQLVWQPLHDAVERAVHSALHESN